MSDTVTITTTPCECSAPGLCARHGCFKDEKLWTLCRTKIGAYRAWENNRGHCIDQETGKAVPQPGLIELFSQQRLAGSSYRQASATGSVSGGGCRGCGQKKPTPAAKPSLWNRAKALAAAELEHAKDQHHPAVAAVQARREQVCADCIQNVDGLCRLCGCPLHANLLNDGKISWRSSSCPVGKWFRHGNSYQPFTQPITRNVLYHVMPWKGRGIWEWNVEQLLRRIDLFNGRRVMAIVSDANCDHPAAVQERVAGHGFEFIVHPNVKRLREVATFPLLLARVESLHPDEITFCAHAKGVTHAGFFTDGSTLQPWTTAMYEACLDNAVAVEDALESHAMAGAFKRYGQFATRGNNRWHYSGTFYWFRNKDVYSRDWRRIDQTFFGAESWPGLMFKPSEAACLFHDHCGDLYSMAYWTQEVEPELMTWKTSRELSPSITG